MGILQLGGLKLQIYEDALSKTLKSCKFDLGFDQFKFNRFLVDLYGMGFGMPACINLGPCGFHGPHKAPEIYLFVSGNPMHFTHFTKSGFGIYKIKYFYKIILSKLPKKRPKILKNRIRRFYSKIIP